MKLVLASGNDGKLRELHALLEPLGHQLISQRTLGIDDAPETASSFVENALLKARHACQLSGLPALADDSGLCVDALAGAPGIYSARFAGAHGDDAANNQKLLELLQGVPEPRRSARFVCVLVLLRDVCDPLPLIAIGTWSGAILRAPQGVYGFDYDPLFLDPELGLSAAEMPAQIKHQRSHRGLALAALHAQLSGNSWATVNNARHD